MTRGLAVMAAALLGACDCPDLVGSRADFHAGPTSSPAYSIAGAQDCPAVAANLRLASDGSAGVIVISRHDGSPRTITADWLHASLQPALAAAGLHITQSGVGAECDHDGPAVLYVEIDNWFDSDRVARAIALELAIEQIDGEVDLVINPLQYLC